MNQGTMEPASDSSCRSVGGPTEAASQRFENAWKGAESATRYVIPGVADINNGFASWRSDIRLFNPATTAVTATLTYFPQPGRFCIGHNGVYR